MKVPFVKYPSIENTYREKEISGWLSYHPELVNEHFILQEKIHGCSIQFIFRPNMPLAYASRNRVLGDENFHGLHEVMERDNFKDFVAKVQGIVDSNQYILDVLRFYGELFGANIQKGVDYGKERQVLFFDMRMDETWLNQSTFHDFMHRNALGFCVPNFGVVEGLGAALAYDAVKDSLILNKENNIIEGVVIKPYFKTYESPDGSLFYLKNKNSQFQENSRAPKEFKDINPDVIQFGVAFREYITENRLQNIFSKYGEIERPNQIGDYIRYMIDDAKEDFIKDYDLSELSDKDQKSVFNVGSMVVSMLKKVM